LIKLHELRWEFIAIIFGRFQLTEAALSLEEIQIFLK